MNRLAYVLSVLTLLVATPALADENLSIETELMRPGVRLLAVEFYATWCTPCMEAVPRWKALHDKYRDKGLRLVVVAVQDDGRCTNPD
jgi:thiol-disulfide isomerase/thioredoxin